MYTAGHISDQLQTAAGVEAVKNSWGQFNAVCTVPRSQPSVPVQNEGALVSSDLTVSAVASQQGHSGLFWSLCAAERLPTALKMNGPTRINTCNIPQ